MWAYNNSLHSPLLTRVAVTSQNKVIDDVSVCWGYQHGLCFYDISIRLLNCSDSVLFCVFHFIIMMKQISPMLVQYMTTY